MGVLAIGLKGGAESSTGCGCAGGPVFVRGEIELLFAVQRRTVRTMPRLRHHWGGSTSSAAIAAVARAEQEERESSSSGDGEEKDATSRELDVYAVLRELLEVHLLLGGQIKNGRSGFKGNERNREADWEASVRDQDGGEGEGLGEFIEVSWSAWKLSDFLPLRDSETEC